MDYRKIITIEPGKRGVRDVGLQNAADDLVWQYAYKHGLIIVSKDADFQDLSVQRSTAKVNWINRGNCTTRDIADILMQNHAAIQI